MVATLPPPDADGRSGPTRAIERRVGLPSGRAVVGALLITVAALGVFLSYAGANEDGSETFVIASRDLPAGTDLTADDLATARLDLDEGLGARSFTDSALLVGQRLIVPVGAGELISRSAVSATPDGGPQNEFTFRVAASRAVNGDLRAGDLVDVYVTIDGTTQTVARKVVVLGRPVDVGRGDLVLRVAVADQDTALAVVDAVNRGEVTLVRATHADNPDGLITTGAADGSVVDDSEPSSDEGS